MTASTTALLDRNLVYVCYCDGIGCNGSTQGAYKLASLGFEVKELIGVCTGGVRTVSPSPRAASPECCWKGELPVPVERCNEGATPLCPAPPFSTTLGSLWGVRCQNGAAPSSLPTVHCMAGAVVSSPLIPSATWGICGRHSVLTAGPCGLT